MVALVGLHMTRNGINQYPARVVLSLNGNGLNEQHPDTITVFRDTTVYNDGPPDIHTHALRRTLEYARYWYDQLKPVWQRNPAHYYTITNEIGGNDPEHIQDVIAFEGHMCALANADGMRCAVGKLAGDTPSMALWQQYYQPFILRSWTVGQNIYARHVYGGNLVDGNGNPTSDPPGNPSRAITEAQFLQAAGYGGGMVLAECGVDSGYGVTDYGRFRQQALGYATALKPYASTIVGLCWWECGQTGFNANYTEHLRRLQPELDVSLGKWTPPAVNKPKIVVVVKPQKAEMTADENTRVGQWSYVNYGRTATHSSDDTLTMLRAGNDDSYAVVAFPTRPSQVKVIEALEDEGFAWQPLTV